MMKKQPIYVAIVLAVLASIAHAQDMRRGNALEGKRMALDLCSGCHVVAPEQTRPAIDVVPPFATIANNAETTEFRIRVFLHDTPHPIMPNFIFTDEEVENLAAYILSLRRS
ncbi:MAG: cytochrome c [Alphaproteobacteria bacterium]|nr:cytochrome c [Alphaproteobacteria bacterium]